MALTAFLSNEAPQGSGSSVVYAAKPTNTSWADESEDLPVHGTFLSLLLNLSHYNLYICIKMKSDFNCTVVYHCTESCIIVHISL